ETVMVDGLAGNDRFDVTPSTTATFQINGGDPTTAPGDRLTVNTVGDTNPILTTDPLVQGAGSFTFASHKPVNYTGIRTFPTTADLSITKTDGQLNAAPGSTITYTVTVTNSGSSLGFGNVQVTDLVPSVISGVSWTAVFSAGSSASGTGDVNQSV